ncbi:MAG: hypothetical protein A4E57_01094 [Syntrophorhabdaceae bacterium PtaU1.Bin034]|nr:MAG: hypothetical protein A4E57_01094 [Syntrophorhabdaceae bacterium PtaU1.Bin034]
MKKGTTKRTSAGRSSIRVFFICLCLLGLLGPHVSSRAAQAAQVTFAWNANSESDLGGYRLYLGNETRTYTDSIDVGNVTTYTVDDLDDAKAYHVALTAYNLSGAESEFSGEITLASRGGAWEITSGGTEGTTETASSGDGGGGGGGGGCFIATAIYGPRSREVQILRDFRDNHLLTNRAGKQFVAAYYKYSPSIAAVIEKSETLRLIGKLFIAPIVSAVQHAYLFLMVIGAAVVVVVRRKTRRRRQS